jgi:hypothetical protein
MLIQKDDKVEILYWNIHIDKPTEIELDLLSEAEIKQGSKEFQVMNLKELTKKVNELEAILLKK